MTEEPRRELIKEFRENLKDPEKKVNPDTEAIVVLSGPEDNKETKARISHGIMLANQFVDQKGEPSLPLLILNGSSTQLEDMRKTAEEVGFPAERTLLLNCGGPDKANTLTQMKVLSPECLTRHFRHITLVSTDYHDPRIKRTAKKVLPDTVSFDVNSVPLKDYSYDVFSTVRGEAKKIRRYSRKGDI